MKESARLGNRAASESGTESNKAPAMEAFVRADQCATKRHDRLCASSATGRCEEEASVSERVKRLEERGIITGYSARINLKLFGLGIMAIVRLHTSHADIKH